jgi:uncharacterized protein YbjT (DUF2867 family)
MNILIAGANGYIGQRLIESLLLEKHHLYCLVRNKQRFEIEYSHPLITIIEGDLLYPERIQLHKDIDAAYYLVHSLNVKIEQFQNMEVLCAFHFVQLINKTKAKQLIYLSGIVNAKVLSKHLTSRLEVEKTLRLSTVPLTTLRAGIIVGSGSASFEIIRDIVEKLPLMITPKWLNTLCQPISIRDVINCLNAVLLYSPAFGKSCDIGGEEVLSYKQMLLQFAEVRVLKRFIITLPVMSPRLSSYWLYFVTNTSYALAVNLVNSMKVNVVCENNNLMMELGLKPITYKQAVAFAFEKIEQNMVISSWKDAFSASNTPTSWMRFVNVPNFGCFKDTKIRPLNENNKASSLNNVWSIGGDNGWYYGQYLWRVRGFLDKLVGGVGLRRGRTNTHSINPGDALDFWRVLVANKEEGRLLLFAEMKLPGDAWLEFRLIQQNGQSFLKQEATFRPKGLWGRIYWYVLLPSHYFIFNGMINKIVKH